MPRFLKITRSPSDKGGWPPRRPTGEFLAAKQVPPTDGKAVTVILDLDLIQPTAMHGDQPLSGAQFNSVLKELLEHVPRLVSEARATEKK